MKSFSMCRRAWLVNLHFPLTIYLGFSALNALPFHRSAVDPVWHFSTGPHLLSGRRRIVKGVLHIGKHHIRNIRVNLHMAWSYLCNCANGLRRASSALLSLCGNCPRNSPANVAGGSCDLGLY
ncbi:hypothetical protein BKA80DRAFT_78097 [Phyllosticta citrichinensis]